MCKSRNLEQVCCFEYNVGGGLAVFQTSITRLPLIFASPGRPGSSLGGRVVPVDDRLGLLAASNVDWKNSAMKQGPG